MELDQNRLIEMYRRLLRIRVFEETVVNLQTKGEFPGGAHTSIGQEGEIVGACMALRDDDYMVGNHRSHGHPIGKGADLRGLMAEVLGRKTGVDHGKGGSMHLADFKIGSLGETSIVGSGIPVAVGAALGSKMMGTDRVCLCFFGDGAANEGAFHEGLNLAAVWKLPAIFLCENNFYAVTTPIAQTLAVKDVATRAQAYDIPGVIVDGQDAIAVFAAVSEAVKRARAGLGPSLIEAKTYRYLEHSVGMRVPRGAYRSDEEIAQWKKRDPIGIHRSALVSNRVANEQDVIEIEAQVRAEVDAAVEYARQSEFPDPAEAFDHLYTNPIPISR
ncbi:MAG: thiamine pyrophosphate-dependent dehydrogenase E1 component subunit alpha [Deltaproteobacteria bacterium]|nr:thiamine pyrophosphate-dependent dehydrogenase E1 component subunit alpha [Deltaproteobacteria bacterium]